MFWTVEWPGDDWTNELRFNLARPRSGRKESAMLALNWIGKDAGGLQSSSVPMLAERKRPKIDPLSKRRRAARLATAATERLSQGLSPDAIFAFINNRHRVSACLPS